MLERLQKILSARGIASRRKAEEYIERGLVKVNGVVATLGQKADPAVDRIEVEGTVLGERQEMLYFLMHKPVGVITENVSRLSLDGFSFAQAKSQANISQRKTKNACRPKPRERRLEQTKNASSVRDLLPKNLQGKIYPVGRLDKESSGLLLFTNDGVLAYRLTHPKFDHEKEYEVTVEEPITEGQLRKLREGITIDGEKTKPAVLKRLGSNSFRIALTEGRNRQIRRMCQKVGDPVVTLTRVRIMTIVDDQLKPGEMRQLTAEEKTALLKAIGV